MNTNEYLPSIRNNKQNQLSQLLQSKVTLENNIRNQTIDQSILEESLLNQSQLKNDQSLFIHSSIKGSGKLNVIKTVSKITSPKLAPLTHSLMNSRLLDSSLNRFSRSVPYQSYNNQQDILEIDWSNKLNDEDPNPTLQEDKKQHQIIGEAASIQYYNHYKKLHKIKEENQAYNINDSTFTAMLQKSEDLSLLPAKIGVIKKTGDISQIKLNNFKLGDRYAQVLSAGLNAINNVEKICVSANRLTSKGASILVNSLNQNTRILDLSYNNIGYIGCEHIYNLLTSKTCRIEELNLEGNKLGDRAIKLVCNGVIQSNFIKRLNLSGNYVTNSSCSVIEELLSSNGVIQEFQVHWNQIKGEGGIQILNGIIENTSLSVVDLAWNTLGNHSGILEKILTIIKEKNNIVHFDLSCNSFNFEESKQIANVLNDNHTIYGFHFRGNYGYVDAKGFLRIPQDFEKETIDPTLFKFIKAKEPHRQKEIKNNTFLPDYKDVCWICDGYQQITFEWNKNCGKDVEEPLHMHFDCEGFRGVWSQKNTQNKYLIKRMLPPGVIHLFYTMKALYPLVANIYHKIDTKHFTIKELEMGQAQLQDQEISSVNTLRVLLEKRVIDDYYSPLVECIPRDPDPLYIPPKEIKEKILWSFPISLFKDFKIDTKDLLNECFEIDWNNTRISKLIKNKDDENNIKQYLKSVYPQLKETYKYFSSTGAVGEVWCIPLNTFTDFVNQCDIIDGKFMKLKDVDFNFIATNSGETSSNPLNPKNALVRHNFMEILFRLAEDKFLKSGMCASQFEAISKLINENCMPIFNKYNAQNWRNERFWNEECDLVLKVYMPVIENIYKRYSGKKTLPGKKKFMCLEELYQICNTANLFDDNFVDREAAIAYNLSMMTQKDELNDKRIFEMSIQEFYEALARIAEEYSPIPTGQNELEWPLEKRKSQLSAHKLESLIHILLKSCVDNFIKESIPIPEVSVLDPDFDKKYQPKKKRLNRAAVEEANEKATINLRRRMAQSVSNDDNISSIKLPTANELPQEDDATQFSSDDNS